MQTRILELSSLRIGYVIQIMLYITALEQAQYNKEGYKQETTEAFLGAQNSSWDECRVQQCKHYTVQRMACGEELDPCWPTAHSGSNTQSLSGVSFCLVL